MKQTATRRRWPRLGTASIGMGSIGMGGIGMGGIGVAVLLGASALGDTVLAPGAGAQVAWVQAAETTGTHYGYGPDRRSRPVPEASCVWC